VIGDGAQWIDQTAQMLFAKAVRILDYYHASEKIWAVAFARWGETSPQARRWASTRVSQLKDGQVTAVIGSIKRLKMKAGELQTQRATTINYLSNRLEQMK
jgi:hypothetical protein